MLVAGGGIIGIACAWYLRQSGFNVTLIDKGKVGDACSRGNCGYICPSHILPLTVPGAIATGLRSLVTPSAPFRLRPQFRASLIAWMWNFAKRCNRRDMLQAGKHIQSIADASAEEFARLFAQTSLDADWNESGMLFLFKNRRAFDDFAGTDTMLTGEFGLAARRMVGDELQSVEPAVRPDLAGGFLYENDSFLRPEALTRNWASLLAENGVEILEGCELLDVARDSGRVSAVETSQGRISADRYVFATGAWSRDLGDALECRIPVEPGKGYSMTMQRSSGCPAMPMIFKERHIGATPFGDGYRLGSIMEFAGFDDSIPAFRMQQLRAAEAEYLRQPGGADVIEKWCSWRPMTWDSVPIIGRLRRLSNAVLATGHNMLGVTMAPATGRLVAEILSETTPHIDPAPFSPARFD